jgi:hypothetical protein
MEIVPFSIVLKNCSFSLALGHFPLAVNHDLITFLFKFHFTVQLNTALHSITQHISWITG